MTNPLNIAAGGKLGQSFKSKLIVLVLFLTACAIFGLAKTSHATTTNGNGGATDVGTWFINYNNATEFADNFGRGFPIMYRPLDQNGNYSIPDSSSTALADFYLQKLADAKIDFILFDQTNGMPGLYISPVNDWITANAGMMASRIKLWNDSHAWKIKYAFAVGLYSGLCGADVPGLCANKQAQYVYNNFYNNASYGGPDNYYQVDGKPLLVLYNWGADTVQQWTAYSGDKTYGNYFSMRRGASGEAGTYGWHAANGTPIHAEVELVSPGWNNHVSGTPIARNNGDTYSSAWNTVLNNPRPRIVMISAFNDYHENTAIWTADTTNLDTSNSEKWYGHDGLLHPSMYWEMTVTNIALLRSTTGPTLVNLYNGSSKTGVQIGSGSTAAQKFTAAASINAIDVHAPSWNNNVGNLTLKLFRWNTDYATSIAGTPVASQTFTNYTDNAYLKLSFAPEAAGTFIWTLGNSSEIVGIWKYTDSTDAAVSYWNGATTTGDYEARTYSSNAPNLALTGTFTASSNYAPWPLSNLKDGNRNSAFSTQLGNYTDHAEWIELNLGSVKSINTVTLVNRPDMAYGFPKNFTIQVWDGAAWANVVTQTNYAQPAAGAVVPFTWGSSYSTSKVRINATSIRPENGGHYVMQFGEIEVYNN